MIYTNDYESPLGNILLAGDEQGLTNTFPIRRTIQIGGIDMI